MQRAPGNYTRALVRRPGESFAQGLTTAEEGPPSLALALEQHEAYSRALEGCGLTVTTLPPLRDCPDAPFVEDAAILLADGAILTRPGAPSRRAEVASIEAALGQLEVPILGHIEPPGLLDGGDVLRVGDDFFIGLSGRTNLHGATQLQQLLHTHGHGATFVSIGPVLHLKTAVNAIDGDALLLTQEAASWPELGAYRRLVVPRKEAYAANLVRVGDVLLIASGYPRTRALLEAETELRLIELEMSEFRKMDGGLTCCSLLW